MTQVYAYSHDGFSLKLSSCASELSVPVDHLHFQLRIEIGVYLEDFEGVVYVQDGESVVSLTEKVMQIYTETTFEILKLGIINGTILVQ